MQTNESVMPGETLSVVVITRNEELHIAQCLRAIQQAVAAIAAVEIVVVDSASTDRTVEIARSLGVRVVSLRPEWELSASAGRYVGFHYTTSSLIMYVDADTLIDSQWFPHALRAFERADVAAVTGWLDDLDEQGKRLPYVGRRADVITEVGTLRGIGMYRRAAMQQAGTFNPWLVCEEEAELALRLRAHGWKLLQLPHQMGCHMRGIAAQAAIIREWKLGRLTGDGKTLLYALHAGNGLKFFTGRLLTSFAFLLTLISILLTGLCLWLAGRQSGWQVSAVLFIVWVTAVAVKKRTRQEVTAYFMKHTLVCYGVLIGLLTSTVRAAHEYPLNVIEENLLACHTML